jgi:hypothetical protein
MNWQDRVTVGSARVPRESLHPEHPCYGVGDPGQPRRQRRGRADSRELSSDSAGSRWEQASSPPTTTPGRPSVSSRKRRVPVNGVAESPVKRHIGRSLAEAGMETTMMRRDNAGRAQETGVAARPGAIG